MNTRLNRLSKVERHVLRTCAEFQSEIADLPEPPGSPPSAWSDWARDQRHGPEVGAFWIGDEEDRRAARIVRRAIKRLAAAGLVETWRPWRGRCHCAMTDAGRALLEAEAGDDG